MDLDVTAAKTKFTYVGEILPNNDRSNAILAQRRDEEQRKREEAERVSRLARHKYITFPISSGFINANRNNNYRSSSSRSSVRRRGRRRKGKRRRSS